MVNEQRRQEAMRIKHLFGQFTCLKSWLMLEELLEPMGINDMDFGHNEHGKPFLKTHPFVHFNISHCKRGIAVAINSAPIGIDIEAFRKVDESLIRKTMNDSEVESIMASSSPIDVFIAYWTKKEAVLKLRGTSISTDLHQVLDEKGYRLETYVEKEKGYAWSVAYKA